MAFPAAALLALIAAGVTWWLLDRAPKSPAGSSSSPGVGAGAAPGAGASPRGVALRVEVVRPTKGGLGRIVEQPGIVHAFNKADLFAKVSGYLIHQKVDIGDTVKKGEILAEIDVPELYKSAELARAAVAQQQARVKEADARVLTAEADRESAAAQLAQAEADIAKYTAERVFRKKELDRIRGLAARQAVEEELVDEKQQEFDAAVAAEGASVAAVATARAGVSASAARVAQAKAEAEKARADVAAAEADLARAEVLLGYTRIVSPYDGVISLRSFHNGDFIRSAAEGATVPILSVKQNDLMRVIIFVPDRDVPFVHRGDPAAIRVDALAGRTFEGKVARFANSEDEQKLMRTEVDLPNPDNLLRDGMYGSATIHLEPPSDNLTIPSASLIEQDGEGNGAVYVVRDGKAHRVPVRVALDNGRQAEIVRGLSPDDLVVVRYNGSIAEGLAVQAEPLKAG